MRIDIMLPFVVRAKMFRIPSFWISAVTAATCVSLELDPMSSMVTFLKAVFAYDTSWVLLTVHTSPADVAIVDLFGANTHGHILVNLL
jgi:hypothetical protein